MADFTQVPARFSFAAAFDAFISRVGDVLVSMSLAHTRADQIQALQAKSDEELAALGIQRDRIVAYVFRDKYYV